MKAPQFTLPDQNGNLHQLLDYKGKWVVVYFYPKDDTPGCTKEACFFRDSISELTDKGVIVLGISKDSTASHKKFHEKYHLNFTLLSDPEKSVINAYHAWGKKKFMGRQFEGTLRNTYIINPSQEIVKIYEQMNPAEHGHEILDKIQMLQKGSV